MSETLLNPAEDPTEILGPPEEGRFDGSVYRWGVSETSLSYTSISVDNDYEWWNGTWQASFDKPPATLVPGEKIELSVTVSGSGTVQAGYPGIAFEYRADNVRANKLDGVTYIGSGADFATSSATGSFEAPPTNNSDLKVYAFLWNCGPCDVVWVYQRQEAGAPAPPPQGFEPATAADCSQLATDSMREVCEQLVVMSQYGQREEDLPASCEELPTPDEQEGCRAIKGALTLDPQACEGLSRSGRFVCIGYISSETGNPRLMEEFGDEGFASYVATTGDLSALSLIGHRPTRDGAYIYALVHTLGDDRVPPQSYCEGLIGGYDGDDSDANLCSLMVGLARGFQLNDDTECERAADRIDYTSVNSNLTPDDRKSDIQ